MQYENPLSSDFVKVKRKFVILCNNTKYMLGETEWANFRKLKKNNIAVMICIIYFCLCKNKGLKILIV